MHSVSVSVLGIGSNAHFILACTAGTLLLECSNLGIIYMKCCSGAEQRLHISLRGSRHRYNYIMYINSNALNATLYSKLSLLHKEIIFIQMQEECTAAI